MAKKEKPDLKGFDEQVVKIIQDRGSDTLKLNRIKEAMVARKIPTELPKPKLVETPSSGPPKGLATTAGNVGGDNRDERKLEGEDA